MPAWRPRFAPKESTSAPPARATSAVRSVEPSSTTSTSTSGSSRPISSSTAGRLSSSFHAGTKTSVSAIDLSGVPLDEREHAAPGVVGGLRELLLAAVEEAVRGAVVDDDLVLDARGLEGAL